MDLQTLSNLFATTYNPDPNVRKAAELQIRKVSGTQISSSFISSGQARSCQKLDYELQPHGWL